jgi:hypothetical protein
MIGVTRDFCRDEKARVEAVRHARPSSISSYHSARDPKGFNIQPGPNGGMMRGSVNSGHLLESEVRSSTNKSPLRRFDQYP